MKDFGAYPPMIEILALPLCFLYNLLALGHLKYSLVICFNKERE